MLDNTKFILLRRFLKHVSKGTNEKGCWLWTGAIQDGGYGLLKVNKKMVRAHRLSYELFIEEIPEGKKVLHECDIRKCVNPDHLFVGTSKNNTDDMIKKGRHRVTAGIAHWHTTFTEEEILEIRKEYLLGELQINLAIKYNTTQKNISKIVNNKAWKHLNA